MGSTDRVYPAVAPTPDVEATALMAEAAGTLERELQAMQAADIEAECCRECAPVAATVSEDTETADRVHSAQASTRVATAAPFFGMEAIMDGSAFEGSLEAAQVSMNAEMENEDGVPCLCTDHAPRRPSRRMPDEAELQRLQQEQR